MNWIRQLYSGRLSKTNYANAIFSLAFFFLLVYSLEIFIPLILGIKNLSPLFLNLFTFCFFAIVFFFAYSLYVRRLHDLGKAGRWLLLGFVPIIGILVGIILLSIQGDEKENKYGKPQEPDSFDLVTIFLPKSTINQTPEKNSENPFTTFP